MKGSQGITTDVNICFTSYEMIKTNMKKKNKWHSLNQNRFYYMNAYRLPYLPRFRGCIILRCICFFLIFSLNYQQGVTRCCIPIDKWQEITKSRLQTNQKQTYGYIWILQKFTVSKGWLLLISFLIFVFYI